MKEIQDWLNQNGIKNPLLAVHSLITVSNAHSKNQQYIAELKFPDVVVPDAVLPLMPLERFDDVQKKITKNKKAPARRNDYQDKAKGLAACSSQTNKPFRLPEQFLL